MFHTSGARISTVTDVGPGVVGERNVADLNEVAEWPLLAREPRRDPVINTKYFIIKLRRRVNKSML